MRHLILFFTAIFIFPLLINSQSLSGIDYISPFHEGLAAIKKGNEWGFITTNGELVIDYRSDVVVSSVDDMAYPVFNSERCLIVEEKKGISYFGYMDTSGKTVIEPQFLNATNFNNGLAIILKLYKDVIGQNDVLDKRMIDYNYMELTINPNGDIVHYLSKKPTHITLSKNFLPRPPEIRSKFLNKQIIAIKDKNNTYSIKKI
jgi:hypothetical protein